MRRLRIVYRNRTVTFNKMIGRTYKYPEPNAKRRFKLVEITDNGNYRFSCGHWCTDTVFADLIDCHKGIQNYNNNQLEMF